MRILKKIGISADFHEKWSIDIFRISLDYDPTKRSYSNFKIVVFCDIFLNCYDQSLINFLFKRGFKFKAHYQAQVLANHKYFV
jgi:hypothetical protein